MGVFSNKYLEFQRVVMHPPFIGDLYLSWCEHCSMTKIVKTDYEMAKLLSYNCRYLDDICTVNLKYIGDIAKDIYAAHTPNWYDTYCRSNKPRTTAV